MLAIWDGTSKGTAAEIKIAAKMGVPTTVIKLEPLVELTGATTQSKGKAMQVPR